MSTLAHALSMSCRWDDEPVVRDDHGHEEHHGHAAHDQHRLHRRPRYSSLGCPACLASPPTPPWPPSVRGATPPRSIGGGGSSGARTAATSPPSSSGPCWRRSTTRARRPRSLHAPLPAPARRRARARSPSRIERVGRGLTTASARLTQDGRDCILALAALGVDRPGPELHDHPAPVRAVARATRRPAPAPPPGAPDIPFRHRFEVRPVLGTPPFSAGTRGGDGRLDPNGGPRCPSTTCCSPPSPTRGRPPSSRASRSPLGVPTDRAHRPLPGRTGSRLGVVPRPLPHAGGGRRLPRGERGGVVDGRPTAGREPPARACSSRRPSPSPRPRSRCR